MSAKYAICGQSDFVRRVRQACNIAASDIEVYESGEACRAALAKSPVSDTVFVGPSIADVEPVNLVAALRKDEQRIDSSRFANRSQSRILMYDAGPVSGSLSSRAQCAGVDQILTLDSLLRGIENVPAIVAGPRAALNVSAVAEVASRPVSLPPQRGIAFMMASGRGGVGKSTLALLTALGLAKEGIRVALADFDVQFGDLTYLLGLQEVHRLDELALKARDLETLVSQLPLLQTTIQHEVAFFGSPAQPECGDIVAPHAADLVDALRSAYDVTVVNAGTYWDGMQVELARKCDQVFLIALQTPTAVQGCASALGLCGRLGIPLVKTPCIINRYNARGAFSVADAQFSLRGVSLYTVAEGQREVGELVGVGCPEELFVLKNPCALEVTRIALDVAEQLGVAKRAFQMPQPDSSKRAGIMQNLFLRKKEVQ